MEKLLINFVILVSLIEFYFYTTSDFYIKMIKIKYLGMSQHQKFRFHFFMNQFFYRNHFEIQNSLMLIVKEYIVYEA